ncbi:hypothetical protein A2Z22_04735 [Candidatus Woesebacteria bacterium RBG_16_34_12]|uniref:Uncharacterized protein n=1 Tax=Candidatus Woesebacteria bacterium RBG_16_34_12 TaxID=1802480 RepID=A0A1F7XA99_9BACT|nr:MAG: hypothetical protein A2Z22_04735 [Candidatus Woesebacteria bacterium RBG_16_34_12]
MSEEKELFVMEKGRMGSLGIRVEACKPKKDVPDELKVVPELSVSSHGIRGVIYWSGGRLGDLWEVTDATKRFISDNQGLIK